MSKLSNLGYNESIKADNDVVGGGGRPVLTSGIYTGKIKLAYIDESQGGALGLNLTVEFPDHGEYKETLWMTNKQKQNFYVDKTTQEKRYLAGFTHADNLALLVTGKPISELNTEAKLVKIWNYDQKAEVPTSVDVLVDLIGKDVTLGIMHELQMKQAKNAQGIYEDTGVTRDVNSISKVFHPTNGKTVAECRAKAETAVFKDEWLAKWEGKVHDRTGGKATQGTAGAPKPNVPKTSSGLFAD